MSGLSLKCLNSSENEFLAEETLINIVSGIDHPTMLFMSGKFGPFSGGIPCEVPLWLAITLRKQGKCTIEIPAWMSVESLEQCVQYERNQKVLGPLPFYYIEIAHLLLNNAKDDITLPDKVAVLLQDLENIRMDRIRLGVMGVADAVKQGDSVISAALNNVSSVEIYSIKRFFLSSMDTFFWLCPPKDQAGAALEANYNETNNNNTSSKKLRKFQKS